MSNYETLDNMRANLVRMAENRITRHSNYDLPQKGKDSLDEFFDEAIYILKKWRKLNANNEAELLSGEYDYPIIDFIVDSYNLDGNGNISSLNTGISSRSFTRSPRTSLESKFSQRL